jgi:hypothetical protein
MPDKPTEKPKPKYVEIGHVQLNAYGWMEICRRIDWEAGAKLAHVSWPNNYSASGFRKMFEAEDAPGEPAWVKRALAKLKIEEKPDDFLPWPYLNDRKRGDFTGMEARQRIIAAGISNTRMHERARVMGIGNDRS